MATLIHSALPRERRPITYIKPHISVAKCVEIMVDQDIGALVVHDGKAVQGLVSERDIVRACLYAGLNPEDAQAIDITCKEVSFLNVNDPLEKAMEVIIKTRRRHVLIVDEGALVAILSIGDVLFYLLEDRANVIEQLKNYIGTDGTCHN